MLIGGSNSVGATETGAATEHTESTSARGMMFPYQFTPNARFTVLESGLDWRPGRVDSAYETHVIRYEYARSLRAFLFTETALSQAEERAFELGAAQRVPQVGSDRRLVGVTAESTTQ